MKCQILFPMKDKTNISLSSAESAHSVVIVKQPAQCSCACAQGRISDDNFQQDFWAGLVWSNYRTFITYLDRQVWANSVGPDQTPQNAASDQGLHCLPLPFACISDTFISSRMELLKHDRFQNISNVSKFSYENEIMSPTSTEPHEVSLVLAPAFAEFYATYTYCVYNQYLQYFV